MRISGVFNDGRVIHAHIHATAATTHTTQLLVCYHYAKAAFCVWHHPHNRALELQLWHCLPAFCRWPLDAPAALTDHMGGIGTAFNNRTDLRPPILTALCTLCSQTRAALQVGDTPIVIKA